MLQAPHDLTILIVDDDPLVRTLLRAHLSTRPSYKIIVADDGDLARQMMREAAPNILITDLDMPGISGAELCRWVKESEEPLGFVYTVVLTGHDDDETIEQAFESGADDYITKPISKRSLVARLRSAERIVALHQDLAGRTREAMRAHAETEVSNSRLERAIGRLTQLASRDELTGLYNRRTAMEDLEREWAAATDAGHPFSCVVLDIDHFKSVNDTYGHAAGDVVLDVVANHLHSQKRRNEQVYRVGGEEFLMLFPGLDATKVARAADRLRESVAALRIDVDDDTIDVTLSLGVAEQCDWMRGPADMINAADEALYAAKAGGRNRVCIAGECPPEASKAA